MSGHACQLSTSYRPLPWASHDDSSFRSLFKALIVSNEYAISEYESHESRGWPDPGGSLWTELGLAVAGDSVADA